MPPAIDGPRPIRLSCIQKLVGAAIFRKLTSDYQMQPDWVDGQPTATIAHSVIKPNDRLSSFDRLEIYNRQYWFRLIDVLHEDFPGLRAVVGSKRFQPLIFEYLAQCPSKSFTLRNLGRFLPEFIEGHPTLTAPSTCAALDMARLEWAHTVAFDGGSHPSIPLTTLRTTAPEGVCLALQPHMTLLELGHAMDDYLLDVKRACRLAGPDQIPIIRRRPRPRPIRIAVYRHENTVYYKRLPTSAYRLLLALQLGRPLMAAIDVALTSTRRRPSPATLINSFHQWTSLGWFCAPHP